MAIPIYADELEEELEVVNTVTKLSRLSVR
jgi:hypothetical protein